MHSQREEVHKNELVFNRNYYPILSKLKNTLPKILLLLTTDRQNSKVFENIPIISFKKGNSLKTILVRDKVPPLKTCKGFCDHYITPRSELYKRITKHISLIHHLRSAYILLDQET